MHPSMAPSFILTPRQREAAALIAGKQRHTLVVGGSRSGKTALICRIILLRAHKAPGSRHVILRFRANAARSAISLDTLPKVARLSGIEITEHRQDGYFELDNGAQIWVGGLDDKERAEKILGMEFATLYFNECSQIPYPSIVLALTRLAQVSYCADGSILAQRALFDLNPTGKGHWTYLLFVAHKDPDSRRPLAHPEDYAHIYINPVHNASNLAASYITALEALPEKARKRFLSGEYQADIDGALWSIEGLEACRRRHDEVPDLARMVIAIDPSGASGKEETRSDDIGICAAGVGVDGDGYVFEDLTCKLGPEAWARIAVDAFHRHKADCIVAEGNYGGDMVRAVIHAIDRSVPVRMVTATRGKVIRAEPISALYEQGKVHHVGRFDDLEDEMLNFAVSGYYGSKSPNRADALVWALTYTMKTKQEKAEIRTPVIPVFRM